MVSNVSSFDSFRQVKKNERESKKEKRDNKKDLRSQINEEKDNVEKIQEVIGTKCIKIISSEFLETLTADLMELTRMKLEETVTRSFEQINKEGRWSVSRSLLEEIRKRDNGMDGRIEQAQLDLVKIAKECAFYVEGLEKKLEKINSAEKIVIEGGEKNPSNETTRKAMDVLNY